MMDQNISEAGTTPDTTNSSTSTPTPISQVTEENDVNDVNKLNDEVWAFIDSYFETVPKNLVNHQLDSYNMFVMSQLPRTIRQFNPLLLMYSDSGTKIEITIGGSMKEKNGKLELLNDGGGIFLSKPAIMEKEKVINPDTDEVIYKNRLRQLYPNEARLKNITYGIHIFVNIYLRFNDGEPMVYVNNSWKPYTSNLAEKQERFNLGFIPVMLGSKLCVLNNLPATALHIWVSVNMIKVGILSLTEKKKWF